MKKTLVALLMVLGIAVAAVAASGFTAKITNTSGHTSIATGQTVLQSVVIGSTTGDVTVKVYDSSSSTATASLLRYSIAISASVSQTAGGRVIPLGGYFKNGVTIGTDGNANTLTATWHTSVVN